MVKVTVNSTGSSHISISNQNRATVRAIGISPIVSAPTTRLSELTDVDASDPNNNETLVYDSTTGKYVVKTIPVIDGGSY